jgi:hypothetical protein
MVGMSGAEFKRCAVVISSPFRRRHRQSREQEQDPWTSLTRAQQSGTYQPYARQEKSCSEPHQNGKRVDQNINETCMAPRNPELRRLNRRAKCWQGCNQHTQSIGVAEATGETERKENRRVLKAVGDR